MHLVTRDNSYSVKLAESPTAKQIMNDGQV